LLCAALNAGCTASFGPGYTINKQEIDVRFDPGPQAHISVDATYELTNTGTIPLSSLEIRLPGRRRFKATDIDLRWDGQALAADKSEQNSRNALLTLPGRWPVSGTHTLHITMNFQTPAEGETHQGFSPDAFFLPAQGWAPQLLPARGLFATGGVPPVKWNLTLRVPKEFRIHTSGDKIKTSKHGNEIMVRARQRAVDVYPYVVAGKYVSKEVGAKDRKIYLWTRTGQEAGNVRGAGDSLIRTLQTYNAVFGERQSAYGKKRDKKGTPIWLVECPVTSSCFSNPTETSAKLLGDKEQQKSGEMISLDTAMVDVAPGLTKMASAVAPALAASWLGYGESPGFFEQDAPLSAFLLFAAAVGREAVDGPSTRGETIRRALATIPKQTAESHSAPKNEDVSVLRAKSFLFFYGLEDRYGAEVFRKAVSHMLFARRRSGFNLNDLIAAFDQETHGNTAEFVRLWMKHPGVPQDFRARYENAAASQNISSKESTP
jgi:hypothetical protein